MVGANAAAVARLSAAVEDRPTTAKVLSLRHSVERGIRDLHAQVLRECARIGRVSGVEDGLVEMQRQLTAMEGSLGTKVCGCDVTVVSNFH